MVVGFRGEAAWQSTPNCSKAFAAQRLSSTTAGSGPRDSALFVYPASGAGPLLRSVHQNPLNFLTVIVRGLVANR